MDRMSLYESEVLLSHLHIRLFLHQSSMLFEKRAQEKAEVLDEVLLFIGSGVVRVFDVCVQRNHGLQLLHRLTEIQWERHVITADAKCQFKAQILSLG